MTSATPEPVHNEDVTYVSPEKHKEEFDNIIKKYNLSTEENSSAIADYLSSAETGPVTAEQFAQKFGTTPSEAYIFLSWINIGVQFKTRYLNASQMPNLL